MFARALVKRIRLTGTFAATTVMGKSKSKARANIKKQPLKMNKKATI